jgi:hypothetical protein
MLLLVGIIALALCGGALVVWTGTRMLTHPAEGSTGAGVAFGAAFEAFDPARARADEDLESRKQMGEVLPTPDPEHPTWKVDLTRNQVRIPRSR